MSEARIQRKVAAGIFAGLSLASVQITAWTSGAQIDTRAALLQTLVEMGNVYNGSPLSLPLGDDVPPEIPQMILISSDQRLRIEVALTRVNLVWQRQSDQTIDLEQTVGSFRERLYALAERQHLRLGRLAIVLTWDTSEREQNPASTVADWFCRDEWANGPFADPANFELHVRNVVDVLPTVRANLWHRVLGQRAESGVPGKVTLTQDINTLAEDVTGRNFEAAEATTFFTAALTRLENGRQEYSGPVSSQ